MGYVGQAPAAGGVTSADILDGTVASADLADNQVTVAKLADIARGSLIVGNASAATAELTKGSASTVLTSDGTDIAWAAAGGASGLTEADQWRLNSNFTDDLDPITANWERPDTGGFGYLGTGMTHSSGVFSFPSTGYWLITFVTTASHGATDNSWNNRIWTTVDNSTWVVAARGHSNSYANNTNAMVTTSFLFDVTAVATHKVRFGVTDLGASDVINGSTGDNMTYMTFLKLGDT